MAVAVPGGLTAREAVARLEREGPNELPPAHHGTWVARLLGQLTHVFALMLWAASALALAAGMPELAVAVVVVVLVNGAFAFAQENRAEHAAHQLRLLLPATARVRRDGREVAVPVREVVAGDVVLLEAGERVPADLEVLQQDGLSLDESLLTGESVPVHPQAGGRLMSGTVVLEGEASALVKVTGPATRLAGITELTEHTVRRPSPLTLQLHRVVGVVSVSAVGAGVVLFAAAVLLGLPPAEGFLFGLGVAVALVPEGLMPTVTLALALGAQTMATRHALVRRLDAVESLGATTVICTDKTGTLTLNQMSVVRAWTPEAGLLPVPGRGYDPDQPLEAAVAVHLADLAAAGRACVRGRLVPGREGAWSAQGDPMEVALDVLARRVSTALGTRPDDDAPARRLPYSADRRRSSVVPATGAGAGGLVVLGAPESVLTRLTDPRPDVLDLVATLAGQGLRVLAVARRATLPPGWEDASGDELERDLVLLGLLALEDPPRPDVRDAVDRCRAAGISLVMLTGDHPGTAQAVAREVGLLRDGGPVLDGSALPADDDDLARALLHPDGAVVARVSPEGKLRIAVALHAHGEVVAMTGDGVNDAPALRAADVGIAMGASGSDAAREAADLVLLDDRFSTVVSAVELGRATAANIRRFLSYHLTDNVAELAPFAVWALSGGSFPLAIGVLQVLALDLGTDMLPALALGTEPANPRTMTGLQRGRSLVDRAVAGRAFGVLGPTEALGSMATFAAVLLLGGWTWGDGTPEASLFATASGSAFAAIAVGQLVNAVACRSTSRPVWRTGLRGNPLLQKALVVQALVCAALLGVPPVAEVLSGSWPSWVGWAGALGTGCAVALADGLHKRVLARRRPVRQELVGQEPVREELVRQGAGRPTGAPDGPVGRPPTPSALRAAGR